MSSYSNIINQTMGNEEYGDIEYDECEFECEDTYNRSIVDNQPSYSVTYQNTQLVPINSFNGINSTKSSYTRNSKEIVSKVYDPFIILAKYIYQMFSFEELNKFYMNTKSFKRDLDELLLQYYEYLELEETDEQLKVINQLLELICEYNSSFNSLIFDNESLIEIIGDYFKDKKKDINCIDPDKNEGYIVSELQLEWAQRTYLIENYYNEIVAQNNKKVEKCINKKSFKSLMYQSVTNYLYGTNNQITLKGEIKHI